MVPGVGIKARAPVARDAFRIHDTLAASQVAGRGGIWLHVLTVKDWRGIHGRTG